MTGDSAGGNLAISLTTMAIARKYRIPDGLLPSYPSTTLSPESFWPSMMCAIDDPILSQGFLSIMAKAISPLGDNQFIGTHNQYASPSLCASPEVLKRFPNTIITLAGICPLKDDGIQFLSKLL